MGLELCYWTNIAFMLIYKLGSFLVTSETDPVPRGQRDQRKHVEQPRWVGSRFTEQKLTSKASPGYCKTSRPLHLPAMQVYIETLIYTTQGVSTLHFYPKPASLNWLLTWNGEWNTPSKDPGEGRADHLGQLKSQPWIAPSQCPQK